MNKLKERGYNLLKKSEKIFKTDMVYLTKGSFWLTLGQITSSLSAFLLSVAFANLVPKETYGIYRYILSIVSILSISTLSGINTSLTRSVARGYDGIFLKSVKTKIKWGLIGGIASLFLSIYYYFSANSALFISFLIASFFLPFMDSFAIYSSFLYGKKDFKTSTKYSIYSQVFSIIIMLTTIFFTKNIEAVIFSYFFSWTIARYFFLKKTIKKYPIGKNYENDSEKYGKHLSILSITETISNQIDKILVFHFLGPTELAIYSISMAVPNQIKSIFKNFGVLAMPKLSEKNPNDIKKSIYSKMPYFMIGMIILFIIYITISPYFYKVFFPEYISSIFYSQIYALIFLLIPKTIYRVAFEAHKKNKELYIFILSSFIFSSIILYFLIKEFGLMGAIIAKVASEIFVYLAVGILFKKTFPIKNLEYK